MYALQSYKCNSETLKPFIEEISYLVFACLAPNDTLMPEKLNLISKLNSSSQNATSGFN